METFVHKSEKGTSGALEMLNKDGITVGDYRPKECGAKYIQITLKETYKKVLAKCTGRILTMKQLKYLNKIILTTMLVCLITACSSAKNVESDKNGKEESTGGYTISFMDGSLRHDDLKWKNDILYKIVTLNHMSDSSLEDKVNDSIENAMTSWINGNVLYATSADIDIYCHSSQYFSFVNRLYYETQNRIWEINDYITIDLKTGKRVMLDDLIRIDEEFVEYIQEHNLIRESIHDMKYGASWESLKEYTTDELLDELKECSMSQQQVAAEGYYPLKESIGSLVGRNSFYLRENQLVIVIGYSAGETHYTFDIDDISDFLKKE